MVLVRRDSPAVMRAALGWRGRLAYLIDDDIAGAADSAGLPARYRQRLAAFESDWHRRLLARADVLVVTSDPLAARLASNPKISGAIRRIEPCWMEPLADLDHFAGLARGEPLRIAHLGTGSHRGALEVLAPALGGLLSRHASVRFTYIGTRPGIAALEAQPNAHREPTRRWPAYRRWLRNQRFHLALYPLLPTAFDRARSTNKLLEHAIVGAVGIYPDDWQPARALAFGAAGPLRSASPAVLLAPPNAADWANAIEAAIARNSDLETLANMARETLLSHDFCAAQQRLWADILGRDIDLDVSANESFRAHGKLAGMSVMTR